MSTTKPVTSYEDLLFDIQNYTDDKGVHYPQIAHLLPSDDQIVDIDLNTRAINAPKQLSVQYDHNAEIIYFRCARYLDNMDLAGTTCLIQYMNARPEEEGGPEAGLFWVPYYDVARYKDEDGKIEPIIIIPWAIGGLATAYPGTIFYSVRFYKIADDKKTYLYNMSTKPAQGEILYGMDLSDDEELEVFKLESSVVSQIYHNLSLVQEEATTYWVDV